MSDPERRRLTLLAIMFGLVSFACGLFPPRAALLWDEGAYLASAETLLSQEPYFTEIHYRPPLLPVLLHLGSYTFPIEAFGRGLASILFATGVVALFLLGNKLYGLGEGVVAAGLMLASPFFLWRSGSILTDIPAAALITVSLFLLLASVDEGEEGSMKALGSGLILAAAFLMRWTSVLAGVAPLALFVAGRFRLRSAAWLAGGVIAGVTPYALWAYASFGSVLVPLRRAVNAIEGNVDFSGSSGERIEDPTFYLEAIVLTAGPLALLGLALYLASLWRRRLETWRTDLPLLLCAVVFPLYLTTVAHKSPRYVTASIPPLLLLSASGLVWAARKKGLVPRVALTLGLAAAAAWTVTDLDFFRDKKSWMDRLEADSSDSRTAGDYLRYALPREEVLYTNHLWPVLAFHSKVKTVRVWPHDLRFLDYFPHNMPQSGLFVHYREVGKEPSAAWLDAQNEFRRLENFGDVVVYSYRAPPGIMDREQTAEAVQEARVAYASEDFEKAVSILKAVGERFPRSACTRGWSLYKLGRIDQAAVSFEAELEARPRQVCALTGLGYSRLRNGELAEAERLLAAALDVEADSVDALIGLGLSYLRQSRKPEAAMRFRRVLELSPGNREARTHLRRAEPEERQD